MNSFTLKLKTCAPSRCSWLRPGQHYHGLAGNVEQTDSPDRGCMKSPCFPATVVARDFVYGTFPCEYLPSCILQTLPMRNSSIIGNLYPIPMRKSYAGYLYSQPADQRSSNASRILTSHASPSPVFRSPAINWWHKTYQG